MAEIKDITVDNFDQEVLEAEGMLLVYYYAPWCKPCTETEKTVKDLAAEVANDVRIVRVNTDTQEEILIQQKIRTIPTFHFMKNGKVIDRFHGKASKLDLMGKLSKALSPETDAET